MHDSGQEILSSANRRIRRVRRSTGRLVACALGFGVAYYFDPENGALRRKRLHRLLQRVAQRVDAALAPEAGDPPPDLPAIRRALRPESEPDLGSGGPAPAPAPDSPPRARRRPANRTHRPGAPPHPIDLSRLGSSAIGSTLTRTHRRNSGR